MISDRNGGISSPSNSSLRRRETNKNEVSSQASLVTPNETKQHPFKHPYTINKDETSGMLSISI